MIIKQDAIRNFVLNKHAHSAALKMIKEKRKKVEMSRFVAAVGPVPSEVDSCKWTKNKLHARVTHSWRVDANDDIVAVVVASFAGVLNIY